MVQTAASDPLATLRDYQQLAPWSLRDLATLTAAILEASAIRPINAAARARPNQRTIRFYVTRGLVKPPDGRGTAATYSYRHLLQVLAIKLRQMEGATLATIEKELADLTGDVLERRVANTLGPALPPPGGLPLTAEDTAPRGRAGRALRTWLKKVDDEAMESAGGAWHRVRVGEGLELHVHESHSLLRRSVNQGDIAAAIRLTMARLLAEQEERTS